MAKNNHLTLAVAGSRKTQGIVESCVAANKSERVLILTYTTANQQELRQRLSQLAGDHPNVEVVGWFSFLISNFVRPFLPYLFRDKRVMGFDFLSPPQVGKRVDDWNRYFNAEDEVRKVHLPHLAVLLEEESKGEITRRLQRVYDRIFIDEVQDLCGYDLEVLKILTASSIPIEMVGDVRQAILLTNPRERKNKRFMYMGIWEWFKAEEKAKRLSISQRSMTWRCGPKIALLADSLFDSSWGFEVTSSENHRTTDHDGVFLVKTKDVEAYQRKYCPLSLRHSASSAKEFSHLRPLNFGECKGLGREHVVVFPTEAIKNFVSKGSKLESLQAARFYVAVTRAEQSVAIVLDEPGSSSFPFWDPTN